VLNFVYRTDGTCSFLVHCLGRSYAAFASSYHGVQLAPHRSAEAFLCMVSSS
jgi:hypothetical protein